MARRPKLLDLFCGAGPVAYGYAQAGWDVVGVDLAPQPRYPFPFLQADALSLDMRFLRWFDAIHASPPCQFGTALRHAPNGKEHPNLIPATRELLEGAGRPYIIENVESLDVRACLRQPVLLCGSMFGLGAEVNGTRYRLQRHRLFELSFPAITPECQHEDGPVIGLYGGHVRCRSARHGGRGTKDFIGADKSALAHEAMGVPYRLTMDELSQAVPPAYTRFLGALLKEVA